MKTTAIVTVALAMFGCGRADRPQSSSAPATQTEEATEIASSDPLIQRFHEQLVASGEDLQSDFGGYLLTLGINPRDIQQDDPKHAYDTVMDKVRTVEDASMRHDMMLTFFNGPDPR